MFFTLFYTILATVLGVHLFGALSFDSFFNCVILSCYSILAPTAAYALYNIELNQVIQKNISEVKPSELEVLKESFMDCHRKIADLSKVRVDKCSFNVINTKKAAYLTAYGNYIQAKYAVTPYVIEYIEGDSFLRAEYTRLTETSDSPFGD